MQGQNTYMENERMEYSLSELNGMIRTVVSEAFPATYWVRAEMSDVRTNTASGHCYMEFVEKDPKGGQLVAKARGAIWARTFRMLKPYFEMETGQAFASGLKVLVNVSVEFHEVYGYSLTVHDIDPAYTLGDMLRRRMEIVRRLKEEGVFTLNKELTMPALPRRIAIVTSPTAAGYEDFLNQLTNNNAGYAFYTRLFPATMQGEKTEESVIAALDAVYSHADCFDVVVIIRGGGSTTDLSSFDSYMLAANCAQFPLPVITGIGHERDDTVLDMVAHTRMKTPTAVAEFLIGRMDAAANELDALRQTVVRISTDILAKHNNFLQVIGTRLPAIVTNRIERHRSMLQMAASKLPSAVDVLMLRRRAVLDAAEERLRSRVDACMKEKARFIRLTEQFVRMASPDYVLKRGYSLAMKDGRIIKHAGDLHAGDSMVTRFADGEVRSTVNK